MRPPREFRSRRSRSRSTWTDLYAALAPQDLARSGVILGFWNSIAARAAPEVGPSSTTRSPGGTSPECGLSRARARRGSCSARSRSPTFLLQGRRDFAFDLGQALAAFSRLKGPKRLYLGGLRSCPVAAPGGRARARAPRRAALVRPVPEGPAERDRQRAAGRRSHPIPWTGRTYSYRSLPARRTLRFRSRAAGDRLGPGRSPARCRAGRRRLETFGRPMLELSLASPNGWPHVVVGPVRGDSAGQGDRGQLRRRPRPARGGAEADSIRLISQVTSVPPRSRLRLTVAGPRPRRAPGNLLYLSGVPRSARARRRPGKMILAGSRPARFPAELLTLTSRSGSLLTQSVLFFVSFMNSEERKAL